ncbi:hypothetical protein HNR23_001819 [Nocardiopsis mwathae]|uniref:Glycosyl hydrolase family 98 putative carbohydrate-binding module domain-containing protein n=1 Tax=Nocardiopsis mwathae TaxID=1472723 RepID=A0A7W9YGK2_9ACTN|nr:NPCBM/NEW2 domain-containing protein [Nocardiopsis mwathae]MBB6171759.1 hypothetical protein [Nocardiopsis mwathae]
MKKDVKVPTPLLTGVGGALIGALVVFLAMALASPRTSDPDDAVSPEDAPPPPAPASATPEPSPTAPPGTPSPEPTPSPTSSADADSGGPSRTGDRQSMAGWDPVDEKGWMEWGGATMNTEDFTDALLSGNLCRSERWAEFNLQRQWSTLEVTVGLDDESGSEDGASFEIIGDGERLDQATMSLGESRKLTADVEGLLRLRLAVKGTDGNKCGTSTTAVWGDPVLYD